MSERSYASIALSHCPCHDASQNSDHSSDPYLAYIAGTNTYLISPPNPQQHPKFLLLDTGQGSAFPAWRRSLKHVLASESARLGKQLRITQCVLSHWHHDHVGGINELRQLCGEDQNSMGKEGSVNEEERAGLKVYKYPLSNSCPSEPPEDPHLTDESRKRENQLLRSANDDQDVGVIHPLHDGQILQVGGDGDPNSSDAEYLTLQVLRTPGHTSDHIALVITSSPADPNEVGTIFTGDAVLGHGTAVFEDLALYMESLEKMKEAIEKTTIGGQSSNSVGDESQGEKTRKVIAFPGHGAVILDAKGTIDEYIAHRAMRESEVLNVVAGEPEGQQGEPEREGNAWTSMDIVKVVYRHVPRSLHTAAQGGVVQVLAKLEGEGRVEKMEGGRWRIAQNHPHGTRNEDEVVEERKSAL